MDATVGNSLWGVHAGGRNPRTWTVLHYFSGALAWSGVRSSLELTPSWDASFALGNLTS